MAQFNKALLPRKMVVRPSGIWNSRAPLHTFLKINKAETREYELAKLCISRIRRDLPIARDAGTSLEDFFVTKDDMSRRSWKTYAQAYLRRNREGLIQKPAYGHVQHDLIMCVERIKFATLIRSITLFESYINCWLLNYLLYKLESGQEWTQAEADFAHQISPVHGNGTPPGITRVLTKVPMISIVLGDKSGEQKYAGNVGSEEYSLLDHMFFWIHFRNDVVHNGGLCTPRTFNRHKTFWSDCMREFARDRLKERVPLTLSAELLHRCRYNIFNSAARLEQYIREVSGGRRGHPWAPNPPPTADAVPPQDAPAMLIDGDEPLSLRWQKDGEFRAKFQTDQ
jgi:hypothetical protein